MACKHHREGYTVVGFQYGLVLLALLGSLTIAASAGDLRESFVAEATTAVQNLSTNRGSDVAGALADSLIQEWRHFSTNNPSYWDEKTTEKVAYLLHLRGDVTGARALVDSILVRHAHPTTEVLRLLALVAHAGGDHTTVVKVAKQMERQKTLLGKDVEYNKAVGESAFSLGAYEKALEYFGRLREAADSDVDRAFADRQMQTCVERLGNKK